MISTSSDGNYGTGAAGTVQEQLFDVVNINLASHEIKLTRIGKGNDRSITYSVKSTVIPDDPEIPGDDEPEIPEQIEYEKVDVTPLFVLDDTVGIVNCNNGTIVTNDNNWECSDFIDVSAYAKLETSVSGSGNASTYVGCAFYDENYNYITGESNYYPEIGYGHGTVIIDVPDNAKYYRFTWMRPNYTKYYNEEWEILRKHIAWLKPGAEAPEIPDSPEMLSEDFASQFTFNGTGYIAHANGAAVETDLTQNHSNYVDISKYEKIEITVPMSTSSTTPAGCAFYDENYNYISGKQYSLSTTNAPLELVVMEVPKNAKYFRTALRNDDHLYGPDNIEDFIAIGYYKAEVEEPETPVDPTPSIPTDGNLTSLFTWTSNGAIESNTGEQSPAADWRYSNYVNIADCDSIDMMMIKTTSSTTTKGMAFYDADKQYISGIANNTNASAGMTPELRTIPIPENAVYLRTSWCDDDNSKFVDGLSNLEFFYCVVTGPSNPEEEPGTPGEAIDLTDQILLTEVGYIRANDGKVANDSNWVHNDYFDVSPYSEIEFTYTGTGNSTSQVGCAFYYNNKELAQGIKYYDPEVLYNVGTKKLTVPDGAMYFRMTWMTPNHTAYYKPEWEEQHSFIGYLK